ncbi:MAG: putative selenate reductase subunit YgfK [Spirochaetaceae bacterium]|nr:putative selenate reductase subunit YgfK [Spirochaetaceae bacterium]
MSEIMRPIAFGDLVDWVQKEYDRQGSVFGIRKEKFYRNKSGRGITLFGTKIASPLGPAAGPHTQLAQNILSACLAGSRFIELKTVQTMDGEELRRAIMRPCINAVDEGYNVEWSTELTVEEAFAEYVKAWFLCHVFIREFDLSGSGIIFNMSVGYSFDGIRSGKIDAFIEGMKNAKNTAIWESCYRYLKDHAGSFERFTGADLDAIPAVISPGITLSTLHGCPREEIERIAAYLVSGKGLHTYIKCNPTLLGYEGARRILDKMGYGYISFDEHHFREDLQFADAVEMMGRLMSLAEERSLSFGVKLTNTFPVEIRKGELPGNEMYMSGRALFPLSIRVAEQLSRAFNGRLPISYSGGADFFNLAAILETGIRPVTVATTLLKPGGYERIKQLAELAEAYAGDEKPRGLAVRTEALTELIGKVPGMERYQKDYRPGGSRKTTSVLPLFDCAKAPCMDGGCPIHQRIPAYLDRVASADYGEAFRIIIENNTAPSITGSICDHQCQSKCTRVDYEDPLEIREAKKIACDKAQDACLESLKPAPLRTDRSVAVIGAGPAGIAAAVFLRRNGIPVMVYEKRDQPYGIVRYVIPAFRITAKAIERDFNLALKLGVEFRFGVPEAWSLAALKKEHPFVVLATGAWKEGSCPVGSGGKNIRDALKFLEDSKNSGEALDLGKTVGIIGGGDVAMDCARAAKRNRGVERATIVYRRTKEFMPAQREELELALADQVEILELRAPESYNGGVLVCEVMRLGEYDASGRRGIVGTGRKEAYPFDTLIGAVGARVDTTLFSRNGITLNDRGLPLVRGVNESSVPDVYIAGDCRTGPATVVKAIADGRSIAGDILRKLGLPPDIGVSSPQSAAPLSCYAKKGILCEADKTADAARCLSCADICEICCDVCPNRANVAASPESSLMAGTDHQVIHIDAMCNECGNCAVFCPHGGLPYRDKFTVFSREEDFNDSGNRGFLPLEGRAFKVRLEDGSVRLWRRGETTIPPEFAGLIGLVMDRYGYTVTGTACRES